MKMMKKLPVTLMNKIPIFQTLKKVFSKSRSRYYIPFEIQSEIIKRLPVKSIVQFRSVSKQWKSFIDNPEFIKTYHINHPNPQHHLLLQHKADNVTTYTSIIDDNSFPQQKFRRTLPEPFNLVRHAIILSSIDGLLCFYGCYNHGGLETKVVLLWNPSLRKGVGIPIPDTYNTRIGFGVCRETNDPKLVKIKEVHRNSWEVQVFTLSSRVWKTVYTGAPFEARDLMLHHVFIDGVIYWSTLRSFIVSFDLKSEKFAVVRLPERLVKLVPVKVNGSLGLLEYYKEAGMSVCGVWMRKDGVNQPFTKIYTVKVEGKCLYGVLGFRKNGEVVLQLNNDDLGGSQVDVYEPSSGSINSVGISGDVCASSAWSYMESLLLLDQSNSIIQ